MRQFHSALLLAGLILAVTAGIVVFGAVTLTYATPVYALAVLMAVLWGVRLLYDRSVTWKPSALHWAVAIFFAYAFARYLTSPLEYESRHELIQLGVYCFFFFFVSANFSRSRDRTIFFIALISLAFAESLYALWQFISHDEMCLNVRRPEIYFSRGGGTFICPNHLAGFLEIVLALLLARVAILRPPRSSVQGRALKKLMLIYAGLVILAGLVATLSRAGWISVTVGFLVFLLLRGWEAQALWIRVLIGVSGVVIMLIVVSQIGPVRTYIRLSLDRQATAPKIENDASLGTRVAMWQSTVDIIADHPFLGTGPATWQWFHQLYRKPEMQMHPLYAHNDYLNFAADYGLVGVVMLLAMVVLSFRHAARFLHPDTPSEQRSFAMGGIVAIVCLLVHSLFDFNLHIPGNVLLLATVVGLIAGMDDRTTEASRPGLKLWVRLPMALLLIAGATVFAWYGTRLLRTEWHIDQGTQYKDTVDFNRAVNHFQEAKRLDPLNPTPYARLGDIYSTYGSLPHRTEQKDDRGAMLNYAIEVYTKSFELNRYQSEVLIRLAAAYDKNGDIESALRAYQEALAADPNNAVIFFHLGNFYLKLGENAKARAAFQKSLDLNFWTGLGARIHLEEIKPQP